MKELSRISFLVVIGFFLFQLVVPTGYFVHFKLNQKEIAKENCENIEKPKLKCNGKCHLAKQLVEIANPTPIDSPAKTPNFENARQLVWICYDQEIIEVPFAHHSECSCDHWTHTYNFNYHKRVEAPPQTLSNFI